MSRPNVPKKTISEQPEPRKREEGNIYQRGDTCWIRYWRRGKQHRESSHSSDPEQATKLLKRRMKEIWAERQGLQTFVPKAEEVYVDELEKAYKLEGGRALP